MRNFMTDRDLIKKLGNLKEIKPDASWLKANRDSLYTQISNSGATNLTAWSSFVINLRSALIAISTPAVALTSIMLVVIASSAYAHLLLVNAKPNQSLYIAREISEEAKLTTILNTDEREKMAGQFAANNAQDITTVLSDPTFNNQQEIAKQFSQRSSDKFANVDYQLGVESKTPLLIGGSSFIQCKKFKEVECGDHFIFIGEVVQIAIDESKSPLLYFAKSYREMK